MDWSKIGDMLAGIAPTIATAVATPFAGPLAPVAGLAVKSLLSALGLAPDATPDAAAAAITAGDPETILKIKQADQQFVVQMRQMDIQLDELASKDRDSARQREVAVRDGTPRLLAALMTIGFFGLLGLMAFRDLPEANTQALSIMLGTLAAGWGGVVQYYFGSSSGSARKTEAMADLLGQGAKK